jgi:hypothetical protein
MVQGFSLRDSSWKIRVVSRALSRTMFQGLEGYSSIEGDEGCSASQRCISSESSSLRAESSMPLKAQVT